MLYKNRNLYFLLGAIVLVLSLSANYGLAQRSREVQARINEIDVDDLRSPDYDADSYSGASPTSEDWGILVAEYEVRGGEDGWADDISLEWNVLFLDGRVSRTVLSKTVTYLDVHEEDEHYAAVFIRPETIRRYFDEGGEPPSERDLVVNLQIKHGGRSLDDLTLNEQSGLPERWWTLGSDQVNKVEHGLLSRDQTPFAPLDYDFYEFIKPE
ncbi:MAG: Amuc_1102 family pilus-like protein [Verrucomicrobiota bacterium]